MVPFQTLSLIGRGVEKHTVLFIMLCTFDFGPVQTPIEIRCVLRVDKVERQSDKTKAPLLPTPL